MTQPTVYETANGELVPCEWFARCDRWTSYALDAPDGRGGMRPTPCCDRCAARVGVSLPGAR